MAVEGWVQKSLEDLAYYYNGCAFKPEDWVKSGLPIIRIANINNPNAEIDYYDGDDVPETNLIDNGDIIFSWSATLAAMRWDRGPAILNQHIFKVVEKPGVHKGYAVWHEMCHLRYRSHDKGFWGYLRKIMPDYEPRKSYLEKLG